MEDFSSFYYALRALETYSPKINFNEISIPNPDEFESSHQLSDNLQESTNEKKLSYLVKLNEKAKMHIIKSASDKTIPKYLEKQLANKTINNCNIQNLIKLQEAYIAASESAKVIKATLPVL
jgi:hypothetical protein